MKKWKRVIWSGFCLYMTAVTSIQSVAAVTVFSSSNAEALTVSPKSIHTGNLWENWTADFSFLNGKKGDGTKEHPYQISTKAHLMGLSELAAMGMVIDEAEGTQPGNYEGAYFELTRDLDLGGMKWMPIGFYRNEVDFFTGEVHPFCGHFLGNGKTISNFKLADSEWKNVGLFGVLEDAEIENLIIKPGLILYGDENVGILAGSAKNSMIRNVTVSGTAKANGTAGGVIGAAYENTVIENCTADHVAVDSGEKKETFAGGIAGKAAESLIADCMVHTGDSYTSRIQGKGYVGGIVGFQNGTNLFNVHVMGTIGENGSQAIGGVTGKYASGAMKVARFEGTIAGSGLGSLAHEGSFIGTHDSGFFFTYGADEDDDLAFLFADTEQKIAAGICGSGIPDDNNFGYDAHIGFWHGKDNFYTLVQGKHTKPETEQYFYEELEAGVLSIIDQETAVMEGTFAPDHFAPNAVGRPTRGYLLSVLQIDTAANVENYYDVATLTAKGESVYGKILDKDTRGAVAAGDVVTVVTAPKNTADEKYQMDGVPTYTNKKGSRVDMEYQAGGAYTFVMPAHDTEVSAVYKKVAAQVRVAPEEFMFRVIQIRTGNRKTPSIVTEVQDQNGRLLARYLSGQLDGGTKVQEVTVEAIVEKNNDVADHCVKWSVDDPNLLILKENDDEDCDGYTAKRAVIELNLNADFFQDIIRKAEKEQAEKQYQYAIPDTVYGNGIQGGLAVLTAKTRPSSSFEGKEASANCKIPVVFQIKDETYVASEGASLDRQTLEFVVTRTLTGNRKAPQETITVTSPQSLTAKFVPDYFDKKDITWSVSDKTVISVDGEEKSASVSAFSDAKWLKDLITTDLENHKKDWRVIQNGNGKKDVVVTVEAEDMLGHREYASCQVTVRFETKDQTSLSGNSGGSGGSGSSSSGGKSGLTSETTRAAGGSGAILGTWTGTEDGRWSFSVNHIVYRNMWAYVYNPYAANEEHRSSWFCFDEQGVMVTGWRWIAGADGKERCYYFNPVSDGSKGRLYQSETTPDGYQVNENGAWVVDGIEQVRE